MGMPKPVLNGVLRPNLALLFLTTLIKGGPSNLTTDPSYHWTTTSVILNFARIWRMSGVASQTSLGLAVLGRTAIHTTTGPRVGSLPSSTVEKRTVVSAE